VKKQEKKSSHERVVGCPRCGNERIKEHYNYCGICGNLLKVNPVIINYSLQKQQA
jgi:ribosomal protein L37E